MRVDSEAGLPTVVLRGIEGLGPGQWEPQRVIVTNPAEPRAVRAGERMLFSPLARLLARFFRTLGHGKSSLQKVENVFGGILKGKK